MVCDKEIGEGVVVLDAKGVYKFDQGGYNITNGHNRSGEGR